jgi:hypothetical protein
LDGPSSSFPTWQQPARNGAVFSESMGLASGKDDAILFSAAPNNPLYKNASTATLLPKLLFHLT